MARPEQVEKVVFQMLGKGLTRKNFKGSKRMAKGDISMVASQYVAGYKKLPELLAILRKHKIPLPLLGQLLKYIKRQPRLKAKRGLAKGLLTSGIDRKIAKRLRR